jgi:hypothetical protein
MEKMVDRIPDSHAQHEWIAKPGQTERATLTGGGVYVQHRRHHEN